MIKIPTIVLIVCVTIIIMYILDQTMGQGNEFNLQIPETEGDMGFVWHENYTKTLIFIAIFIGVLLALEVYPKRSLAKKLESYEHYESGFSVAGDYYSAAKNNISNTKDNVEHNSEEFVYSSVQDFKSAKKTSQNSNQERSYTFDESKFDGSTYRLNRDFDSDLKRCFEVLGVSETASPNEIKIARDKMILCWHPDRNKSAIAESIVMKTNEAYSQLKKAGKC